MTGPVLIGREREIEALAGLLARGTAAGQVMVLVGEPGIGKTALLDAAGQRARAAGYRVLRATGVESEAQLPFAGLHQLVRPVLGLAGQLRPVHRNALLAAFGLEDRPRPEPFLIAVATVSLLAAAAAERPVALLADDMQWLDPQSQEVLTFTARRAAPHPVVIIGAARDGHPTPFVTADVTQLQIRGVDDAAAEEILRVNAEPLSPADRRRIQAEARGNPLALLELPVGWPGMSRPGMSRPGMSRPGMSRPGMNMNRMDWEPPTLSARLERAFAGRLAELPALTRDAVLVAAVDPATELAEILAGTAELSGLPVTGEALAPAVEARLLRIADGQVQFRHPLVRSGILQSETVARRHAANAALAAVLPDEPYRRTWHRAQSIVGPDDRVADELEANVAVALSRGAVMSAIRDLQRSAQLTASSAGRGHRLLVAAEHAFGLGRAALVGQLIGEAARLNLSELDRARMLWLREIFNDGVPGDATRVSELCDAARRADGAGDRDLALNLLLGAALRCWWADAGPAAGARVAGAAGELDAADDPRYIAVLAVAEPVRQGAVVMSLLSRFSAPGIADADALRVLGMAAHAVGDPVRSIDFLDRAEKLLRDQGRLGLLSQVLSMQVIDRLELGDWDRAAAAAEEGVRLATDTDQPIWRTGTLVCDAMNNAFRGQVALAFRYAAEAELASSQRRLNDLLSCVQLARGSALVATGRHAEAYTELRRLFDPEDPSFHRRERYGAVMFLADAGVAAGQRADARAVLAGLEEVAAVTPAPLLHVHLRYARAVLADDAAAGPFYADLVGHDLTRWPWARARGELAYGRWLCRRHRHRQAREVLSAAAATFTTVGAVTWADLARHELRAAR